MSQYRDACRVMRQRVDVRSRYRYVNDEDNDDGRKLDVKIGGLSARNFTVVMSPRMVRPRSTATL